MIRAECKDNVLLVQGHSTSCERVCAAVSAITGTLYANYGAERPEPGSFRFNFNAPGTSGVRDFVCNVLRDLAKQYPEEIQFHGP